MAAGPATTFTIVQTLDEQGTATVTFTIPDGVVGTQLLTIGGPGGTAVELPIEVAAAPEPVGTSTSGSAPLLVWRTSPVDYKVTVHTDDGSPAVGTLLIRDGSKIVKTVELTAADNGRVTVKLGKLSRGLHILTAQFTGDGFERSLSWPSITLVL